MTHRRSESAVYGRRVLSVQVLGRLAVYRDGEHIALPPSGARLIAYLACHPGPQSRYSLAARFWPDVPAGASRGSVRSAVRQLRKVVGDDAVVATRSGVGLAGAADVDLVAVERHVSAGDLRAVAVCTGELLPDVADERARDRRSAHHAQHAATLVRLAAAAVDEADTAPSIRGTSRRTCALIRALLR